MGGGGGRSGYQLYSPLEPHVVLKMLKVFKVGVCDEESRLDTDKLTDLQLLKIERLRSRSSSSTPGATKK